MSSKFRKQATLVAALSIVVGYVLCSCDGGTDTYDSDAWIAKDTEDTHSSSDTFDADQLDADALSDIVEPRDSSDALNGLDGSADADTDVSRDPVEFDESLWQQANPCADEVTFPEDNEEFAFPSRSQPSQSRKITRDEFVAELGFEPSQALSVRPGNLAHPGDGRSFDLYVEPETDVSIHFYAFNKTTDFAGYRLNITVMVDYEPVDATYVRWSPDRSQKLLEKTATGINYDIESDFEILDVVIPASAIPEQRMYEISVSFNVNVADGRRTGESRRFALFNGAYNRPSRPCAEPRLDIPWSEWERTLYFGSTVGNLGPLFYEGITSERETQTVIDVEPGETRRMYFSALSTAAQEGGKPTVLVPLFDGEPMGLVWWITQGNARGDYRTRVDARKSFEVTFPEEPGVYVVQVATWEDPYLYWRERDGTRNDDVSLGSSHDLHESSNPLHFRVVESTE